MRACVQCVAFALVLALSLTLTVLADQANQGVSPASLDLLKRAADPNPTLQSYIASATLSATLNAVVPVHETFNGTVYYLKPTRKVVFSNVPGPLSRFKTLTSSTPSYEQALAEYTVTPLSDDGTVSKYSLTPKKQGSRVTNLTVAVDDHQALIVQASWTYSDGGSLSLNQTYQTIATFRVPAADTITARFPQYSVDGDMTFSNYQPNAHVSPSIFDTNS